MLKYQIGLIIIQIIIVQNISYIEENMKIKILLAGDGGQGIQLLSDIICKSAFEQGLQVTYMPNYGLEQRGGVSLAFIQVSDAEISYPKFTVPNLLLIMSPQARERTMAYQASKETEIIDIQNYQTEFEVNKIPSASANIFFLGLILKKLGKKNLIDLGLGKKLLEEKLLSKPNWENNLAAFEFGIKY